MNSCRKSRLPVLAADLTSTTSLNYRFLINSKNNWHSRTNKGKGGNEKSHSREGQNPKRGCLRMSSLVTKWKDLSESSFQPMRLIKTNSSKVTVKKIKCFAPFVKDLLLSVHNDMLISMLIRLEYSCLSLLFYFLFWITPFILIFAKEDILEDKSRLSIRRIRLTYIS